MKNMVTITVLALVLIAAGQTQGASVAIIQGGFWTDNLANNLTDNGQTVTLISDYTAGSLSAYDAVIHYGNTFTDHSALEQYVQDGGVLVETPWYQWNESPPASLQMWSALSVDHYQSYPSVTVLDPANGLLSGVSFPAVGSGFE
ncbi:MAG: hypothetical protein ACYSSO_12415, partial [Planctomycetota bacterium]